MGLGFLVRVRRWEPQQIEENLIVQTRPNQSLSLLTWRRERGPGRRNLTGLCTLWPHTWKDRKQKDTELVIGQVRAPLHVPLVPSFGLIPLLFRDCQDCRSFENYVQNSHWEESTLRGEELVWCRCSQAFLCPVPRCQSYSGGHEAKF